MGYYNYTLWQRQKQPKEQTRHQILNKNDWIKMYVKKTQMQLVSRPLPKFESILIVKEEQDKTCSRITSLCFFLFRYET